MKSDSSVMNRLRTKINLIFQTINPFLESKNFAQEEI